MEDEGAQVSGVTPRFLAAVTEGQRWHLLRQENRRRSWSRGGIRSGTQG